MGYGFKLIYMDIYIYIERDNGKENGNDCNGRYDLRGLRGSVSASAAGGLDPRWAGVGSLVPL